MNTPVLSWQAQSHKSVEAILLSTPFIVVLCCMSVIGMAFSVPLYDLDEGAFSEATREMLVSGNWVSTYLNGEPRHDKPILIYWFQAISASVFGIHAISFRLPSIVASFLCLYFSYRFVKEICNEHTAKIFVWVFSTFSLYSVIFKSATADALLNLWINLIFFEVYRLFKTQGRSRLILLGLLLGMGFLTKGPVAVVLPVFVSLLAFSLHGKIRLWLWAVSHPYSWGAFLFVAVPWHIAVYLDQGMGFFEGFYLGHNLNRFSETRESHGGSLFYYALLLPFVFLPFIGSITAATKRNVMGFRKEFSTSFMGLWFLVVFILFSFSGTQLPHYILYGMTPVFILLSIQLHRQYQEENQSKYIDIGNRVGSCLALLLFCLSPFLLKYINTENLTAYDGDVVHAASALFLERYAIAALLITMIGLFTLFIQKERLFNISGVHRSLITAALVMISVNFVLLPLVADSRQRPVVEAAQYAKQQKEPVISWRIAMPSFSVYSEKVVRERQPKVGDIVFTRSTFIPQLVETFGVENVDSIFQKNGVVLIRINGGSR